MTSIGKRIALVASIATSLFSQNAQHSCIFDLIVNAKKPSKAKSDVKNQLKFSAQFHMQLCCIENESYLKNMIQTLWAITGSTVGFLYEKGVSAVFDGTHPHDVIIKALRIKDAALLESALV